MRIQPGAFLLSLLEPEQTELLICRIIKTFRKDVFDTLPDLRKDIVEHGKKTCTKSLLEYFDTVAACKLKGEEDERDYEERFEAQHKILQFMSRYRIDRVLRVCADHGITGERDKICISTIVDRLIQNCSTGRPPFDASRVGSYAIWCDEMELTREAKFREDLLEARNRVALILPQQACSERLDIQKFCRLPFELRMHVFSYLVPTKEATKKTLCVLGKEKVLIESNALPALSTLLHKDSEWDFDLEFVKPMLTSLTTLRVRDSKGYDHILNEFVEVMFRDQRHEVTITSRNVFWMGSEDQLFDLRSPFYRCFFKIRKLRLTIWTSTNSTDIETTGKQVEKVVSHLNRMTELQELDVFLCPLPNGPSVRASVPLLEMENLLKPFEVLSSTEMLSVHLGDTSKHAYMTWHWKGNKLHQSRWVFVHDSGQLQWQQIKNELSEKAKKAKRVRDEEKSNKLDGDEVERELPLMVSLQALDLEHTSTPPAQIS